MKVYVLACSDEYGNLDSVFAFSNKDVAIERMKEDLKYCIEDVNDDYDKESLYVDDNSFYLIDNSGSPLWDTIYECEIE